jgi:hypothetical protein
MPTELKPKIVMAHNDNAWWVIIYGNDDKPIWKTNKGTDTPELALRKMLQSSSDLVFGKVQEWWFCSGGLKMVTDLLSKVAFFMEVVVDDTSFLLRKYRFLCYSAA